MKKALALLGLVSMISFSMVGVAAATNTTESLECPYVPGYSGCE
ncbi:hypothetical protein OS242_13145 [Tumebacillus sp. DT12]|uniref:Uncharacterized protein n=1 Tax=Tumebacillus lacus TaxID=2995335 RepID=A0ABT3X5I6_9BACL|nr:hypothetical protein [Tumebacillus lacus]MCX7570891.1 hypothetical protein [Tumebacillus lacus]